MNSALTALWAIFIVCSGCQALTASQSDIQSIGKQTESATAHFAPVKHSDFKPQYHSELTDKYPDAITIYDSSPKASPGVYLHEGLVFVIITIDTNKESIKYLEGTAMLRASALLRKKYPNLPSQFRIRNRLVEKTYDDETGIYRYAIVCKEVDIKAILAK